MPRPPHGIASLATGKASTRRAISPASEAGCMATVMPGSTTSTVPAPSTRSPAWPLAIVLGPMADNGSHRRKCVDIHRSPGSPIAEEAIGRIAQFYAVKKQARGLPPDRRAELRQAYAAPVFDDLERWLAQQLTKISGKSPLSGAIRYALARMECLRPYLDNGIPELDNSAAEPGSAPSPSGARTASSSVPKPAARPPLSPTP